MAAARRTASVRMYNVGFGDAFVVTIRDGKEHWRMLVDCGVHAHGRARPLEDAVHAIIDDLRAESADGVPRLDVVAATHHHADHIAGFQFDEWAQVEVGEVWVPFVEDPDDDDARELRKVHTRVAQRLTALLDDRVRALGVGAGENLTTALWFAANSSGNELATDRLLGRNSLGFATTPVVRYLPSLEPERNCIDLGIAGAVAHVLGPSRDADTLKRMHPPSTAGWLTLDSDPDFALRDRERDTPLFDARKFVLDRSEIDEQYPQLSAEQRALDGLDVLNDDALLGAASVLERSVNNTSLFFVLEVGDVRLLFPGDSQHGAWEHVLNDPATAALVSDVAFLKLSHHGSHNGTPRRYIEQILPEGRDAMLPYGEVERWKATIPKDTLLQGLALRKHRVVRADAPEAKRGKVTVNGDLWSEIRFRVPTR